MNRLSTARRIALMAAAVFYLAAGILHFVRTGAYLKIVPPFIPAHPAMVYITGACEILGGLGLLIPITRRWAAWGLAALLIAVFPANIYMAASPLQAGAAAVPRILLWGRLALQPILIWWVLWCSLSSGYRTTAE
jgi:uncharacterized membrane protein